MPALAPKQKIDRGWLQAAHDAGGSKYLRGYDSEPMDLQAAGDDVQVKATDSYIAFRRLKNFACVELRNQLGKLLIYARIDPGTVAIEPGFTRDVRGIGHFGTGDLEITLTTLADLDRAKPLFDTAYQNG